MSVKMKMMLYAVSTILLLALCLVTGGSQSPLRFVYFPLIVLLGLRISHGILLKTGFTFSILFVLMGILDHSPGRQITDLLAEALSFFMVTIAAGLVFRALDSERARSGNAIATFQGLSEDLKHRTMNLQTTLDALSKAHRLLQESDRDKSRFIANVSHELRTPLTSIRSYSEILLNYDDIDGDTQKEFIRTINAESERMTLMVNDNLDLLRIEAGKLEMKVSPVDPAELIEGSARVVAPMAEEKGLSLVLDIPSGLPCVSGDRNQLTQVLINLFNNAIKFTAKGTITAGVCRKGGYAEFFVADTGEGIYPEEKEVIFDEFYRISGELPDRPQGSGLGLSIARKIVDYHGGSIRVDSTPGKGSTFFFTIPVAVEEPRMSTEKLPFATMTPSGRYGPILVIYQSTAIRQSLRKRLENLGYQTVGADSLKRGKAIAVSVRPVLIISDLSTGGDDFKKLEIWARDNRSVVMLATLYLNPVSGDLCLAASGYLDKPFDRDQIVSLFERFSNNKGRFFIISPEKDEARKIQALLGAEGISANLYMDESEAVQAGLVSVPDGVIIGSVPSSRLEDMIATLKGTAHFKQTPFFFVREGGSRQLRAVTPELLVRTNGSVGISPLIMAIEKAYAEKWGKAMPGGG